MSIAYNLDIDKEEIGKRIIERGSQLLNNPTKENLRGYLDLLHDEVSRQIIACANKSNRYGAPFGYYDSWETQYRQFCKDTLENAIFAPARVTALQLSEMYGLSDYALEIIDCMLKYLQIAPGLSPQFENVFAADSAQLKSMLKAEKREKRRLFGVGNRSHGALSDIQAIKDVQRIRSGGTAKLSISQVTNLLINLPDAERNLTGIEFSKVYALYKELRKCNTKLEMDLEGYYETAVKIIIKFDKLAPYEKYCGGNSSEYLFLMDEIRKIK